MHVFHSLSVSVERGFVQRAYQLGTLASTPVFIQINCCREIYPYHLKGAHCQAGFLSHLESRHSCQCWQGPGAMQGRWRWCNFIEECHPGPAWCGFLSVFRSKLIESSLPNSFPETQLITPSGRLFLEANFVCNLLSLSSVESKNSCQDFNTVLSVNKTTWKSLTNTKLVFLCNVCYLNQMNKISASNSWPGAGQALEQLTPSPDISGVPDVSGLPHSPPRRSPGRGTAGTTAAHRAGCGPTAAACGVSGCSGTPWPPSLSPTPRASRRRGLELIPPQKTRQENL